MKLYQILNENPHQVPCPNPKCEQILLDMYSELLEPKTALLKVFKGQMAMMCPYCGQSMFWPLDGKYRPKIGTVF